MNDGILDDDILDDDRTVQFVTGSGLPAGTTWNTQGVSWLPTCDVDNNNDDIYNDDNNNDDIYNDDDNNDNTEGAADL